jgi:NADH-quinone oxidoreductase subunit E
MPLTDETRVAAREIMSRYPRPRSALLPMLHLVQSEEGYVTPEGVRFCAEELGLTKAEVGAVVTFYTMYKRRPTGEFLVSVCTNTLCDVLGGEQIYETLSESLGVGHDQTTADGRITLEHAECLAACDYAPVVTVNYEFYDQQTPESATALVDELRGGRRPMPTRGAPLCTFKEISRQLAGFVDDRPGAVDAGPAGEPTLIGTRLAVERGETAPTYDAPVPLDKPAQPAAAAGAGAPPAAPAPTGGERPAAATTPAEQSAAAGTARYGGPPGEASSGGAEGGQGMDTAASDPAAGMGPDKEAEGAQAGSASPDAPTAGGPDVGTGTGPATSAGTGGSGSGATGDTATGGTAGTGGSGGSGGSGDGSGGTGDGSGGTDAGTGAADQLTGAGNTAPGRPGAEDRPARTNRGRKTRRKEG